jgi:hypothetical protein
MKEAIRAIASEVVEAQWPSPRYAIVQSFNPATRMAVCRYPGESVDFSLPSSGLNPTTGAVVRVLGRSGARYIDEVVQGVDWGSIVTLRPSTHQFTEKTDAQTSIGTSSSSPTYITSTYLFVASTTYDRFFDLSWFVQFAGASAVMAARPMYQIDGAGGFVHAWIDWGVTSAPGGFDHSNVSGTRTRVIPAGQQIELRLYAYANNTGTVAQTGRCWQSLRIAPVVPVVMA